MKMQALCAKIYFVFAKKPNYPIAFEEFILSENIHREDSD
jgi:hypothetical protein